MRQANVFVHVCTHFLGRKWDYHVLGASYDSMKPFQIQTNLTF